LRKSIGAPREIACHATLRCALRIDVFCNVPVHGMQHFAVAWQKIPNKSIACSSISGDWGLALVKLTEFYR
jgi:hypothetical protein